MVAAATSSFGPAEATEAASNILTLSTTNTAAVERRNRIFLLLIDEESSSHQSCRYQLGWLSTAAIFRQPSILRNLICPLATRLKRRTSAACSLGSKPCVFTRRRNSP